MTEENSVVLEQFATELPTKPEPKKPSFKRVSATKTEDKQPSFKRVKTDTTNSSLTSSEASDVPIVALKADITTLSKAPFVYSEQINLDEISSMIEIRNYVNALVNGNFTVDKSKLRDLERVSLLLDRKIVDTLTAPDFKSFVKFEDAQQVVQAAAKANTIQTAAIRSKLYG